MDKKLLCDIKVKATGEVIRGAINVSLDGGEALYSVGIGGRTYKGSDVDVSKCYDNTGDIKEANGFNYSIIGIVITAALVFFAYKLIVRANQHSIWALFAAIVLTYFLVKKIYAL